MRAVLGGSPDGYDGRVFRTGMVPLDSPPVRAALPVYLAALGPRMLELAGRIADGVILNLMTPAQAGEAARTVRAAALAAGRDPASVEVACVVHCCLADDDAAAAAAAAARGTCHATCCIPPRRGCSASLTAARACAACRERVLAGDRAGAADLVPQQAADGFVAHGGADECLARVARVPGGGRGPAGPVPDARRRRLGIREDDRRAGGAGRSIAVSEELVVRFFAALEAGDIATLREIYAPDAVIWHNDDLIEQPVEENLKVLAGLHRVVSGLRYDITRRVPAPDGVLQQHVLRGTLPERRRGRAARRDVPAGPRRAHHPDRGVPGLGKRATIKAAREAAAG